jgi:hypothetical protein
MNKETEKNSKKEASAAKILLKEMRRELKRQKERAFKWKTESISLRHEIISKDLIIKDLSEGFSSRKGLGTPKDMSIKGTIYPLSVIWLCVSLYHLGISYRKVCAVLVLIGLFTCLQIQVPSHVTVSNWVQRTGLYLLKIGGNLLKKETEKWCFIIDESYSLGKSRLLLILGVRLSCLSIKKGGLRQEDVVPLVIRSQEHWKTEDVSTALAFAQKKIGGTLSYVVSDQGKNLVSSYKVNKIAHIPDWAHYSANILEKCYSGATDFKLFNDKMGVFKIKKQQSTNSQYVPPMMSVKIRFMNYLPFLDWANIMLINFQKLPELIAIDLHFLQELRPFIGEMTDLFYKANEIGLILKTNGINKKSHSDATEKLNSLKQKYPDNPRVNEFIAGVTQYFELTIPFYIPEKEESAPNFDGVLASSEIIESIFGKLKHRCSKNPKKGFSSNSLLIPLFCKNFSPFDVYNAINTITMTELEIWKNDNLCNRKISSFRNAFK